jgi:hypothetical protein
MTLLMTVKEGAPATGAVPPGGYPAGAACNGSGPSAPTASLHGSTPGTLLGPQPLASLAAAFAPPFSDPGVMAGEQYLRHTPAAVLGRSRVVGVLGLSFELLAERLLDGGALVAEGTRQLAHDGVADDHRRGLTARQDVAADRNDVAAEVLEDALVEALVATTQQRQGRLGGELVDERVVEQAPAGGPCRRRRRTACRRPARR